MAEVIDHLLETAGRYPRLTPQQEIELGRSIRLWLDWPEGSDQAPPGVRRRGQRALDKFLLCNLRLAHYVSKRFLNRGVPPEDLMQAATEGLLTACRRFKPVLGFRFSSYAVWWAQQSCQVIVAQQGGGLRLPTTVSEQLRKVAKTDEQLRRTLCRCPTDAELELELGLKPGQLLELRHSARRADTRSIDQPMAASRSGSGEERSTLGEVLPGSADPAAAIERQELQQILDQLLTAEDTPLTPQQRYLLRCRYLLDEPLSFPKLSGRLNMNRETLRRMERQALEILRPLLPETIRDYRALL